MRTSAITLPEMVVQSRRYIWYHDNNVLSDVLSELLSE